MTACVHHYIVEPGYGAVRGVCKRCGPARTFTNQYGTDSRPWRRWEARDEPVTALEMRGRLV